MVDRSDAADARRLRWLLDGNGLFMESADLCRFGPCDPDEKDNARAVIDEVMSRPDKNTATKETRP